MTVRFYRIEKTINIPLIPITLHNAQIIANKLCRHFKLPKLRLIINKSYRTVKGQYFPSRYAQIYFHKDHINFKVLIHELSHHWRFSKDGYKKGQKHHTNKELRYMTRMYKYSAKKDFWGMLGGVE